MTVELPRRTPGRVLVIDDDFAISEAIADFLEEEGFSVVAASNGIDALNRLRSGLSVDAIVLDVVMPLMDGWDFRAAQLANPVLRGVPVIVISASSFTRDTIREQFKAYDALPKPIELEHFLRAVHEACACSTSGSPSMAGT